LPNFINVLTGDCAVVGPRPEIPEMLRYYSAEELIKFSVKPGLTGYAQVSGRNNLTFRETNSFDVQYVVNRSWKLDLRIFCKTTYCIVMRKGAL
jgi:lipopolysaccharide/colanic/teichoic acid biosynthesis glycosyltransferase